MKRALLLAALLAAACAAEPPKAPPSSPTLASITVYRPHSDLHRSDYPYVYVEKQKQGALIDGGAVTFDVEPGIHRFTLANPALWEAEQSWQLSTVAGKHYYFRLTLGPADGPEGSLPRYVSRFARVDEMPAAAALAEFDSANPDLQAVLGYVKKTYGWDKDAYRIEQRPNDGRVLVYWVVYKDDEFAAPTMPTNSFELHVDPATHEVVGMPVALGRKRS